MLNLKKNTKKENPTIEKKEKNNKEGTVLINGIVYKNSFGNVGGKLVYNKEGFIQTIVDKERKAPYCISDADGVLIGWVSKESITKE